MSGRSGDNGRIRRSENPNLNDKIIAEIKAKDRAGFRVTVAPDGQKIYVDGTRLAPTGMVTGINRILSIPPGLIDVLISALEKAKPEALRTQEAFERQRQDIAARNAPQAAVVPSHYKAIRFGRD